VDKAHGTRFYWPAFDSIRQKGDFVIGVLRRVRFARRIVVVPFCLLLVRCGGGGSRNTVTCNFQAGGN